MSNDPITEETAIVLKDDNRAFDAIMFDDKKFDRTMAFAEIMSKGAATVPKHLAGNAADCMAIIIQASSWGMNPEEGTPVEILYCCSV